MSQFVSNDNSYSLPDEVIILLNLFNYFKNVNYFELAEVFLGSISKSASLV